MSQKPENPILSRFLQNIDKPIPAPMSAEQLEQYGEGCRNLIYRFSEVGISSMYFLTENPPKGERLHPYAHMGIFSQERTTFTEPTNQVPTKELDEQSVLIHMRNLPVVPTRFENDGNIDDIVLAGQAEQLLRERGLPIIMTSLVWRPATSQVIPLLFTVNGISPGTAREIAIGHAQRALDLRFGK